LTQYAIGLTNSIGSALANFIAPIVRVGSTIGQFKKFNTKQDFVVYDTARAVGGAARRIMFHAEDPTYNCQPQALEIPLDDAERDAEGDFPLGVQQAKTSTLVSNSVTSHEDKVITKAKTLTAEVGLGVWSDPNIDPVAQLDAVIRAMTINAGRMPNRVAWGLLAWERFRNHAKVRDRQSQMEVKGLNLFQASAMLLNPSMEHMIGVLSKEGGKMGSASAKTNIVGDDVFIFHASPNPTPFDPSFMKTFQGGDGGIESVRTYRDESCRSDILAVDWSEDIQQISTILGARITTS